MKALSIKQPWSWLICQGHKDIENRNWSTSLRGPVLIHAGGHKDNWCVKQSFGRRLIRTEFIDWLEVRNLGHLVAPLQRNVFAPEGGIVGIAEIVDCVTESDSPWFVGRYGFVLANARLLPFTPLRGQLGFFEVPDEIVRQLGLAAYERASRS